jgi:hypothetical protein
LEQNKIKNKKNKIKKWNFLNNKIKLLMMIWIARVLFYNKKIKIKNKNKIKIRKIIVHLKHVKLSI